MHTLPRHLYSPHSPSLLSSTPPPHQPLVAPLFSPAFPSSYSFNENGTPLVRERVLTHSCGRVHHESSPMPSLSLSLSGPCHCCSHYFGFLHWQPPLSMYESHRGTSPAILLTAVWSPKYRHPSTLLFSFLFRLGKTMNNVSRFFSIFRSSYTFKENGTPSSGTRFDALI